MALTTQSATIGGATRTLIVAADGSSNIAAAHVTVDSSGAEKGVTGNPLAVAAAALPLPTGAATAALQPAINADGGAQTHVMNFPATQPVSAVALPLPTGAATAAKQPALGTAGSASADVLTVQGAASMTALKVDGSAVTQPVIQAGGTGTDYSANTATAITTAQATTLLATIPVTATRAYVEVQNQSAATVSLVRDDGAGANQTLILLAPGAGAGQQGGGWSSTTFKGRLRVYGVSGAQVSAFQE